MVRASLLFALLLGAAGCDDTFVDPFLREGDPGYTLYALVVADRGPRIQRARVQRVRAVSDPPSTTRDPRLVRGGTIASSPSAGWSQRIVFYPDQTAGTVFESTFQVGQGSTVSVSYQAPDGRRVSGTGRTPPAPRPAVEDPVETADGGERSVSQRIAWEADRLGDEIVVDYEGRTAGGRIRALQVVYGPEALRDDRRAVEIDLLGDLRKLRTRGVATTEAGQLSGLKVQMAVLALGDAGPPGDAGRAFVQGATAGYVTWTPEVSL